MSAGILSNAVLIGAKIVKGPAPLSVSTSPAASTAVTSVDSRGLLLAAVAAGSSAMPSTLPSPSIGTAAQAAPVGPAAIGSDVIGSDIIGSEVIGSEPGGAVAAATPADASDECGDRHDDATTATVEG